MFSEDRDALRPLLTAAIMERIADSVQAARLPDRLYGLALAYLDGEVHAYTYPLYETSRQAVLRAGEDARALWDPSWVAEDQLPPGAPEELLDRDLEVDLSIDTNVRELCERYWHAGAVDRHPDVEELMTALKRLWSDVAAALTRLDWGQRGVEITGDFVALAYEHDPTDEQIQEALRTSLGVDAYHQLDRAGRVPHDL